MPMPSRRAAFGFVALGVFEDFQNMMPFEVVERQRIGVGAGAAWEFRRQRIGREPVAVGHDHAALHGVAQFADVAVPRVAFQRGVIGVVDGFDAFSILAANCPTK